MFYRVFQVLRSTLNGVVRQVEISRRSLCPPTHRLALDLFKRFLVALPSIPPKAILIALFMLYKMRDATIMKGVTMPVELSGRLVPTSK